MPNINDKLKIEERNERTVRLWPEGMYFKAYERSAYLFVNKLKDYHPCRSYVILAERDVVSIKFPQTVLETLGVNHQKADDGSVVIKFDTVIDEQQFLLWREALPLSEAKKKSPKKKAVEKVDENQEDVNQVDRLRDPEQGHKPVPLIHPAPDSAPSPEQEVADRIRGLNLESATPMECMLLLIELKKRLSHG